jgi:DNA-binding response OmpR family regulator
MVADKPSIKTLLIVEDQPATRECLASVFRAEDYRVVTAADRQEALQHSRSRAAPDLVVLDMRPAVDASGFLEERHRDAALASVPVIALTEPGTDCTWVVSLGATDSLSKPVSIDLLLAAIRRYTQ